jgi:hypothetical protein
MRAGEQGCIADSRLPIAENSASFEIEWPFTFDVLRFTIRKALSRRYYDYEKT